METVSLWLVLFLSGIHSSFSELVYGFVSDVNDKCICSFDVPLVAVCTQYDTNHKSAISSLEQNLANLTSQLDRYIDEWNLWDDRFNGFEQNVSRLMTTCQLMEKRQGNEIAAGDSPGVRAGVEEVRKDLLLLEDELEVLKGAVPQNDVLSWISSKVDAVSLIISNLTTSVVGMGEAQSTRLIAELESDLQTCKERPSDIQQRLAIRQWPNRGSENTCRKLSLILRPFTVRNKFAGDSEGPKGPSVWFSDPFQDPTSVWMGTFEARVKTPKEGVVTRSTLHRFNDTILFEISVEKYFTYYLPDLIEKTSIVAYDGYLYYLEFNTRTLVKFDYQGNTTVVSNDLPNTVGIGSQYYYSVVGERLSIDLEVDESGLWMIYSSADNHGFVIISKINTTTLEIEDTWVGNFPKKALGDCFVACGTLYCFCAYDLPNVKVSYFYDTKNNEEGFTDVVFESKYGDVKSVKYNPYDQKLYVWDKGNAVVYDLVFG